MNPLYIEFSLNDARMVDESTMIVKSPIDGEWRPYAVSTVRLYYPGVKNNGSPIQRAFADPDRYARIMSQLLAVSKCTERPETPENDAQDHFIDIDENNAPNPEKTPQNVNGRQCDHCQFAHDNGCWIPYFHLCHIDQRRRFERALLRLAAFGECTEYLPGERHRGLFDATTWTLTPLSPNTTNDVTDPGRNDDE